MNTAKRLIDLITHVVIDIRTSAQSESIELHKIRDLCVDEASNRHPDLVDFLSGVRGLVGVSVTLSQLPHLVSPNDDRGMAWTFVPTSH